ncbi:MAG: FAD-dependent oxidoreductase [Rhodothermales bacterium]
MSSSETSSRTLIVGTGLAGSAAAWHLRRAGHDVLLLDASTDLKRASGIGGGLANPMMARKGRPT